MTPRGEEVELTFIRKDDELDPAADGSVAEVVAKVFMPRENWERLVSWLPEGLEQWRRMGL